MSVTPEERTIIRQRFDYRCGYCSLHEIWFGDELEIDHFQPHKYGGTDALENLIYACAKCNRYKASYCCLLYSPQHRHLLHPHYDNVALHIAQNPDGQLIGLTPRGQFHIHILHLNRPRLVQLRQLVAVINKIKQQQTQVELDSQLIAHKLYQGEQELRELQNLITQLARLMG
jgi:hypothetical protein